MEDMRQSLLLELIDAMHGRQAEKMFPPNPDMDDQPAATGIPGSEAAKDEKMIDKDGDAELNMEEPSDDELEDMMKEME